MSSLFFKYQSILILTHQLNELLVVMIYVMDHYVHQPHPTSPPRPTVLNFTNSCTLLREQLVLKDLFDITYGEFGIENIVINEIYNGVFFRTSLWVGEPEPPEFLSVRPLCVCVFL